MTDPCNCSTVCPHGDKCFGSHSDAPERHWYACDRCTPKADPSDLYAALRARARRGGTRDV